MLPSTVRRGLMSETTFEQSLKKLEERAQKIASPEISLEEAIQCYEEGIKEYAACQKLLDEAKQRIVTLDED